MPRRGIDLTEDQWALVKSHAARRQQTISQFFVDVLGDLGMDGHPSPATTAIHVPVNDAIDARHTAGIRPGEPAPHQGTHTGIGRSQPAPKPARKK